MRLVGKPWFLMLSMLALLAPGSAVWAVGANAERGQLLYQNHCTGCHSSVAHLRASRKAHSVAEIRKQVLRWSGQLGLEWRADEVADVVEYLNVKFYGFEAP